MSLVSSPRISPELAQETGEIPYALHVVSGMFIGGGQVGAMELAQRLQASGLARTRLCILGRPDSYFDPVNPIVVPEYDGRYNNPRVFWRTVRALRRVVRHEKPAILHSHGWDADVMGALAIRGRSIRHISHIRSLAHWARSRRLRQRLRVWLTRWALESVQTSFLAVSYAAKAEACGSFGWAANRVKVIHDGVDTIQFCPKDRSGAGATLNVGRLVLGTAARLGEEKGIDILLRSVARLQTSEVDWELRIAGTGRLRQKLEGLARNLGIVERVRFLGMVEDMPDFYRALDVFVLASWTEGLPRTVLEAMACGIPVVATAVGGTHEVVRDGYDGFLISPGDTEVLASSIVKLATAPRERVAKGILARCRIVSMSSLERVLNEVSIGYLAELSSLRSFEQ